MTSAPQMPHSAVEAPAARETALQKLVSAFILTGPTFLLLPGIFLGVWNFGALVLGWFVFGLWSGASYDPARGTVEEGESELVGTMK